MRRIAIALTLLALVAGLHACAADAPTKPPAGGGGGQPSSAVQVQLFTSDANPKAGTCTLVEAVVSLNGNTVPDGTSVSFTTTFGTFSQNGLATVAVTTLNSAAVTALCGPGEGSAKVKATATVSGKTGSANLTISFQPSEGTLPFVASCAPSLGTKQGGDSLTLNGGRFFGSAATTRVQFTVNGVTRDGIVQSVTANQVIVLTPGFPELASASNPAAVTLTLGTNTPTPTVLSLPNCFTFGTSDASTPIIAAVLPSTGSNDGNTRVTIIGSGFATSGVQVFFGAVEATVLSVNFNQIIALSPPAFGVGLPNLNQSVAVTVKNITSGTQSNGVTFRYAPGVQITSASNNTQNATGPFSAVTIFGAGFQAPVAVGLAGVPAFVQTVSATEVVVLPAVPLFSSCTNITGAITVTNINSGDTAAGSSFTYVVPKPAISGIVPDNDHPLPSRMLVTTTTINGQNFPPNFLNASVTFGSKTATVTSGSTTSLTVDIPPGTVTTLPACENGNVPGTLQIVETVDVTVTDRNTGCAATDAQAFSYLLPCVLPTATPTSTNTPIPTLTPSPTP